VFVLLLVAVGATGCDGSGSLSDKELRKKAGPGTVQLEVRQPDGTSFGTGVIFDADKRLVLTNDHVVNLGSAIKARVLDSTTVPATLVAEAPCDDLAVVRLDTMPSGAKALDFADSDKVSGGDHVMVLGYPESLEKGGVSTSLNTNTGTVSNPKASASLGEGSIEYPDLIEHQAPVNHGNSGGPLVDDHGKVIGINTLTGAGSSEQSQGQYYAIAINHAKPKLPQLISGSNIDDLGWNLTPIADIDFETAFGEIANDVIDYLNNTNQTDGVVVGPNVSPGSAADKAGFLGGEFVERIDGDTVTSLQDVCDIIRSKRGKRIRAAGILFASSDPNKNENIDDTFSVDMKVPQ
jgi:S1-C subfamily serine protease